jgi:hypothetical protein
MIDDDDECGAVGGMRIGRENRSTRRKPNPVPLSPPQIPHDRTWATNRLSYGTAEFRHVVHFRKYNYYYVDT